MNTTRTAKILLGLTAGMMISSSAFAYTSKYSNTNPGNSWYLGASGDLTWLRHSDMGGGGNVQLGYEFWPSNYGDFRLEGEAGYHAAGGKDGAGDSHYFTYMGNLYYDFNNMLSSSSSSGWHIVPYIGGGLGDAAIHNGNNVNIVNTFHHHQNDFAWQGMAGLNFTSSSMPRVDWLIGYRYLDTDDNDLHAHNLEVGLRYHF